MKISILTPTYNRAKLLDKLYTSIIVNQNNNKFEVEWLIMDDGSTDNTRQVINSYINQNIVDIQYYYEENKGKMYAINQLVKKSTGDIIIECDSDDYFDTFSFKVLEDTLKEYPEMDGIYALAFLKYDQNGENMGNEFPEDNYISTMYDLYFKKKITGEKLLVYSGPIRRRYEYELEDDEKFVTEARLHHKMDKEYQVKCFNKKFMICEYKEDGYTNNINKLFVDNPKGYYEYFKEIFEHDMHGMILRKRLYVYKHFILFSVLNNQKNIFENVKGVFNKICVAVLYLPGKIATKKFFKKLSKSEV